MTRRAKRPVDKKAAKAADDAFYAKHPELVRGGKRIPLSADPNDPCAERLRQEWLDLYEAKGGKIDPASFPSCKPGSIVGPCPVSSAKPLSEKEAGDLFKVLAGNKNIPFNYPVDCCYSRAHIMARMMEMKGISSEKYWLFNKNWGKWTSSSDLHPKKAKGGAPVTFPNPNTGKHEPVQWVYHVAPTVKVKKSDGSVVDMVMDPSLSDRPMTKAEWKAIQGDPPGAYEEVTDSGAYFSNKRHGVRDEDPDLAKACEQVEKHKLDRDAAFRAQSKAKKP